MKLLWWLLVFLPLATSAEIVVLNGLPDSRVISNAYGTQREQLSEGKQHEFRILITKKDDRYYWATRENREVFYTTSGAIHIFIDPNGSGYIEVFDNNVLPESRQPGGKRYSYKEHLRLLLENYTYWGQADEFYP